MFGIALGAILHVTVFYPHFEGPESGEILGSLRVYFWSTPMGLHLSLK